MFQIDSKSQSLTQLDQMATTYMTIVQLFETKKLILLTKYNTIANFQSLLEMLQHVH
jgi:hypothetical protein